MSTPPPSSNGTVDVKPGDLYRISGQMADQQGRLDREAGLFLKELDSHSNVGGAGKAVDAFNSAYREVGEKVLQVWAKSVVSVGGAAVGFTATANHYVTADAASNPSHKGAPATRPAPQVIQQTSSYGSVPVLKWDGLVDDGTEGILADVFDGIDHAVEAILRPIAHHALRWGKAADLLPLPEADKLDKVSVAWQQPGLALADVDAALTGLVGSVTVQGNPEWYGAMRSFCSAIWGTTAWGKSRLGYEWKHEGASGGSRHPAFAVVFDTCDTVSDALRQFAEAAHEMRTEVSRLYRKAVYDALPKLEFGDGVVDGVKSLGKSLLKAGKDLAWGITLEIDEGAINAAVTRYESVLHGLVPKLRARVEPLDEALMSLPTYEAEEARAEGFGARALDQFKHRHKWTGQDSDGAFRIDLAGNEYLGDGHTLDKHVGKTDEQLAQRLRDQQTAGPTPTWPYGKPYPGAASSFKDAESAQRLTQYNINQNSDAIKAWLTGPPPPSNGAAKGFESSAPSGEYSGRSVTKQPNSENNSGYRTDGMNARAISVKGIKTILRYDDRLDPPFVVLTSMPQQ
ncbi:RNase A-like domain-containing protein [Streptomyces caatingaensis]|uniref:RNase A-like domain-containing protein n=1 Tax=Streptomyces caatingaensis TaxID=1678637 RepID=UPI001F519693|nr:RNase A-like domain-containing protein [Streptomyces caatingaensis]